MAFTNTSFEDAGVDPGDAAGWALESQTALSLLAEFNEKDPSVDAERFEAMWVGVDFYLYSFNPLVDIVAPLFDTDIGAGETFEDFEEGWSLNHGYSFTMGSAEAAVFDDALTPEEGEDFEEGWSANEDYAFEMGPTDAAMFDSGANAFDAFEASGWVPAGYDFAMGSTDAALFGGGADYEGFDDTFGPIIPSSIDYDTSTFTYELHGLLDGDIVRVSPSTDGGLMPTPLQVDTNYYITDAAADTFRLSATSGGSYITLGAAGFGVSVTRDPFNYWPVSDVT